MNSYTIGSSAVDIDLLPQLAVISDVAPQQRNGGELLLFRLLGDWPAERLRVVHSSARRLNAPLLRNVQYKEVKASRLVHRCRRTRIAGGANLLGCLARPSTRQIADSLSGFLADGVLTVAQDFLWLSAADWCRETRTPLHLILHDDWPEFLQVPRHARWWLHSRFGAVLKQAASRLCVSPGMAEEYERRYGCRCDLLLPNRGDESPEALCRTPNMSQGKINVGYLGGLPLAGYSRAIRSFADIAGSIGGRLSLYGSHTLEKLAAEGLQHPHITPYLEMPRREMLSHLTTHTSALFCPVSFLPEDATIMRMLFPSKLADYTACGLPIIIWGPEESSAVKWAKAHDHAAFVCTDPRGTGIAEFLQRIRTDQDLAIRYARGALAAGEQDFSLANARSRLVNALTAGRGASRGR